MKKFREFVLEGNKLDKLKDKQEVEKERLQDKHDKEFDNTKVDDFKSDEGDRIKEREAKKREDKIVKTKDKE